MVNTIFVKPEKDEVFNGMRFFEKGTLEPVIITGSSFQKAFVNVIYERTGEEGAFEFQFLLKEVVA